MTVSYVLQLDDVLVRAFATEAEARRFIAEHPPKTCYGTDPDCPLDHASNVVERDIIDPYGYQVTELHDGVPVRCTTTDDFDPAIPLFPIHDSAA